MMTKEEKRALYCELLASRPHGEGPARLARWCRAAASTVYRWQEPGGPWPGEEKEARMWDFFSYTLDERGNPVAKKVEDKGSAAREQLDPEGLSVSVIKQFQEIIDTTRRDDAHDNPFADEQIRVLLEHVALTHKMVVRQNNDETGKKR